MKEKWFLNLFVALSFSFVCLHFFFSGIYLTDGKYTPFALNAWVYRYVQLGFYQDWRLFAPEAPSCHVGFVYELDSNKVSDHLFLGKTYFKSIALNPLSSKGMQYRVVQALSRNMLKAHHIVQNLPQNERLNYLLKDQAVKKALKLIKKEHKTAKSVRFTYLCAQFDDSLNLDYSLSTDKQTFIWLPID